MNNNYVVGFGEVLWDFLMKEGMYKLGGAPFNFAYHTKQFGLNSLIISAIGEDDLGRKLEQAIQEKQLPYQLAHLPQETGVVNVINTDGIPKYEILENKAWDYIPLSEEMLQIAAQTQAICFGSLAQRNSVTRATLDAFLEAMPADALRIFDINLRQNWYSEEIITTSLQKANILKINEEELHILQQMFNHTNRNEENTCRQLMQDYQLDMLILTCGNKGSYVFSREEMSYLTTREVEVEDTVGAGDSFTASFIASILGGKSLREAHRIAAQVSAYVCTQSGATPIIPDNLKSLS